MSSSTREEIQRDFDELGAVVSRVLGHCYDAVTTPERLNLLERLERETRRLRAPGHELINQLAEQAGPDELGGRLSHALADRLRITRATRSITPRSHCATTTCPGSFGVKNHRPRRIALFAGELWRAFGEGCRDPLRQILGR